MEIDKIDFELVIKVIRRDGVDIGVHTGVLHRARLAKILEGIGVIDESTLLIDDDEAKHNRCCDNFEEVVAVLIAMKIIEVFRYDDYVICQNSNDAKN